MSRRMRRAAEHRLRLLGRAVLPVIAALSLMAAATPAPHSGNTESQHYYADAREQLDRGDGRAALIQLKNALRADPSNVEARFVLGTLYLATGQADLAEHELKQARQEGFPADQVIVPLAQAYLEQAKYDALLRDFPAGAQQGALEADILNLRGAAFGAQQQADRAEASFRQAIQANPKDPKPFLGLARLAMIHNDYAAAGGFADQSLGIDANYSDAHAVKAEAARLGGNTALAVVEYDKALAINKFNRVALLGRAAMRIDQGQLDTAEGDIKLVLSQSPHNVQAIYLKAFLATKRNDSKSALAILQAEPSTVLAIPTALFLQSALQLQQKDTAQAEQGLERYLSQVPGDNRARKLLAQSYLSHQDGDKAMLVLTPALDADPHDLPLQQLIVAARNAQYASGDAAIALEALRKGDRAGAHTALEKAVATRPDFVAGWVALGDLDLADGRLDDARLRYDRVLANQPTEIGALIGEARIMLQRKDTQQAESWLQKAHAAHPKSEEPVTILVELAINRKDGARATALARELLAVNPKSVRAHQMLGRALATAGDQKGAHDAFDAALALNPDDLDTRADLIRYDLALNQPDAALKTAEAIPASQAEQAVAEVLRGDTQLSAGRYDDAEATYRAAYDKSPSAPLADRLFEARSKGKLADPVGPLEGWVKDHPQDVAGRNRLALRYMQSDNNPAATRSYEIVLKDNPDNLEALNNLAYLYQRAHDPRARATAEQAYKLAPDNADVADTYGWVLIQTGDAKTGLPIAQKALAAQPDRATYRYHAAAGLVALGKPDDAKQLLAPLVNSGAQFDETADAQALFKKIGGR
jgi:Tfp pilus assembly protein PilF